MPEYKFRHEQEVTVTFPKSRWYPRGLEKNGVISARRHDPPRSPRYTVLFDNDTAETLIPESWIRARASQEELDI